VDEASLREYAGVYEWDGNAFLYLQVWPELTATNQLVAFEETGELRALYPTGPDRFFAGPGAAIPTSIESRIEFHRDASAKITSLSWTREGAAPRVARRVDIERREDVRFSNGNVQLAGTLISPTTSGPHPAVILVHASGAEDREYLLPFARFLIRHGMAVLGYDKRGVGGSTGDWSKASFDDLAGDVVAAFEYLKTRSDIDRAQIGMLGWSQAGWVMPLAATRSKDLAFLISISGAGVSGSETTIDQARNEMVANGMRPQMVDQIVELMRLQYDYLSTGQGWDQYMAAREQIVARMGGNPPDAFPATPDHPYLRFIRPLIVYDPAPTIRQLQLPVLALFGELDNNIMADKNRAAWEAALRAGGHRDYTLQILPKANHALLEAKVGNNAEMKSLQRIVPAYFEIVLAWLSTHINGLVAAKSQGGPRQLPIRRNRRSDVSVGNEQRAVRFSDFETRRGPVAARGASPARADLLIDELHAWGLAVNRVDDVVSPEHGFVITRVVSVPCRANSIPAKDSPAFD
jgi:dienelactone hydrolase